MKTAKSGEFLFESQVPDFEHDGDYGYHIDYIYGELECLGVNMSKIRFSSYSDEDGEYVTIRGAKNAEIERIINDAEVL